MSGTKGRSGRKKKATRLKLVEGNPGKRAVNKDEPQPKVVKARAPRHSTEMARKEFRRLSAELERIGLLTMFDTNQLALYCDAWADYIRARELFDKGGPLIKTDKGIKKNPAATVIMEAFQRLRSMASEFGFTPAARAGISVPGREEDLSKILSRERA